MVGVVFTTTVVSVDTTVLFVPPSGDVWEWFSGVAREFRELARSQAPPRRSAARHGTWATGRMQRSIYASVGAVGARVLEMDVGSTSPHATYVLRGTAYQGYRYIYTTAGYAARGTVNEWIKHRQFAGSPADAGYWMPVTRVPFKSKYYLRVRGQKPNPFLQDGYRLLRARHSSLPRMDWDREFKYAAGGV